MKIQQLSVSLENKPGRLLELCRLLAREEINIRTLTLASVRGSGVLRLLVSDLERAAALLREAGYTVAVNEVVAIELADRPGGLSELLSVLESSGINIEYSYAFTFGREGKAVLIFSFDQPTAAIERLQAAGINVVGGVELYL